MKKSVTFLTLLLSLLLGGSAIAQTEMGAADEASAVSAKKSRTTTVVKTKTPAARPTAKHPAARHSAHSSSWNTSTENSWPAVVEQQTCRFKFDQNGSLLWSRDGKTWEADEDGMWGDKEGDFYKVEDGKLVMSEDGGVSWSDVPDWKWQASDAKWYRLDPDTKNVYVKK